MEQYTYLLVNFFTIIICFIFSFHKKIKFYTKFKIFLKSCAIVSLLFIIWDIIFTKYGIWWFNDEYLIGLRIFNLPIEEILFFFCIPFSCVFTYYCLNKFFNIRWADGLNNMIVFATVVICSVIALRCYEKTYTFVTATALTISMIYLHFFAKFQSFGKVSLIYTVLLLGFFPVNGVLTGTGLENPIVNYNPNEFLNFRMGTIPIEDMVYGYLQFLWIVYFFEKFNRPERDIVDQKD